MEVIKLSAYEKGCLMRILEKAKNNNKNDLKNGTITKCLYDLNNKDIMILINRINGHYKEDVMIKKLSGEEI